MIKSFSSITIILWIFISFFILSYASINYVSNIIVTTIAGSGTSNVVDGTGISANFQSPWGCVISYDYTYLIVADHDGNKLRKVNLSSTVVTTVATGFSWSNPIDLAINGDGNVFVTDSNRVSMAIGSSGLSTVVVLAGTSSGKYKDNIFIFINFDNIFISASSIDGTSSVARFNSPFGLTLNAAKQRFLYVVEPGSKIRQVNRTNGLNSVTTVLSTSSSIYTVASENSGTYLIVGTNTGCFYKTSTTNFALVNYSPYSCN